MKLKKVLAGVMSLTMSALAFTAIPSTSADAATADLGTAYVMFTNGLSSQWDANEVDGAVCPTITGDGQYTASVPVTAQASKMELLALQTDLVMDDYPGMNITVDSILFDGESITYNGPSDGAFKMDSGVRVNILNTWGNDVVDIDAEAPVAESITINFTVVGSGYTAEQPTTTTTTETAVTTTGTIVTTTETTTGTEPTEVTTTTEAPVTDVYGDAFILFSNGMVSQMKKGDVADAVNPEITGNGSYTATLPISSPAASILLFVLQTNIDAEAYPDANIAIDSILFDGQEIAYTPSTDAFKIEDGVGYRVNVFNTWGNNITDIDNTLALNESVEISFTVSGLPEAPVETTTTTTVSENTTTTTASGTTTKAGTVTSAPATGDASPIVAIGAVTLLAGATAIAMKKKKD